MRTEYYDMHDWDLYGCPGEYLYGDDVYLDDYYMDERWLPVEDFPDYWISNKGRVWSNLSGSFIEGSPTGRCGHIDVSLYREGLKYHRFIHRMVAEAFIPNPNNYRIVRHLDDCPSNNCVENLAWGTQKDNMGDAISNGRFRYLSDEDRERAMQKRRVPIKAVELSTGRELRFISQGEASRILGISQTGISAVICGKRSNIMGYYFYIDDGRSIPINRSTYRYVRHNAPIKAIDIYSGEELFFRGQTEAAINLGISVSSVSMVLSGKMKSAKGYIFEYADEEDCDD